MTRLVLSGLCNAVAGPFDLSLDAGACLAITGPSGAGKSVLLRMIGDLDPHQGEALLDGVTCGAMPAPVWRSRVTYSAAEAGWWHDRVGDHFAEPPSALVERLGLRPDILDQTVRLCSTGERQRLALVRALAGAPAVLLLDEPTASLDSDSVAATEALLRERLAKGMTLVLVTHDLTQADRLGDRHQRLVKGKFAA